MAEAVVEIAPSSVSTELMQRSAVHYVPPPSPPPPPPEPPSGLGRIATVLRHRWKLISAFGLVCMLLGGGLGLLMPPKYTAVAEVMLGSPSGRVANIDDLIGGLALTPDSMASEVEILGSRLLAARVVGRLSLERFAELNPDLSDPDALPDVRELVALAKEWAVAWMLHAAHAVGVPIPQIYEREQESAASDRGPLDDVIDVVLTRLMVEPQGRSQVIQIGFTASDPGLAATIANAWAEEYLLDRVEVRETAAESTGDWLGTRLAALREEVGAKEAAVEQFRKEAGLLEGVTASIKAESLSALNRELVTARAAQSGAKARYDQVASGGVDALSDVLLSETIRDLRAQEAGIAAQIAELSTVYGPRHPQIIEARQRLAGARRQIEAQQQRIVQSMRAEVNSASLQVAALVAQIDKVERELRDQNADVAKLRVLEREAEASQEVYREFLIRATTGADVAGGGAGQDGRILSPAAAPRLPSSPPTTVLALLGLMFGCFTGAAAAFGLEMGDNRFQGTGEVEQSLALPVVGVFPLLGSLPQPARNDSPERHVLHNPKGAFAEALRALGSRLMRGGSSTFGTSVMVTSSLPGEGKTSISLSLARRAAMLGMRVVLVDGDGRLGRIHEVLDCNQSPGLTEMGLSRLALAEVIRVDPASGMHFIPSGDPRKGDPKQASGWQLPQLMDHLCHRYQLVIVDTPPVLPVYDACMMALYADQVVLVVDWELGERSCAHAAAQRIREVAGETPIKVVLNKVDLRRVRPRGYPEISVYGRRYSQYYG